MNLPSLPLPIDLPGPATELRNAGKTFELIRELGDNYDAHHKYVAEELERVGAPVPAKFEGDFEGFMKSGRYVQDLLQTETVLRFCAALRQGGKGDALAGRHLPLVGGDQRLLSLEDAHTALDTDFAGPPIPMVRP